MWSICWSWFVFGAGCKSPSSTPPIPTEVHTADTGPQPWPTTSWSIPAVERLRDGVPGMAWSEGNFDVLLLEDCQEVVDQLGHCLGINPLTPFFTFQFEADAPIGHPVGVFQLGPDEAIVFVGETPPEGVYLGLQNYVYARDYGSGTHDLVVATVSPSINQRNLAYVGDADSPWGRLTAVVWTANQATGRRIEAELSAAGIPEAAINIVPIPDLDSTDRAAVTADPDFEGVTVVDLRMGYEPTDDWFTVIVRMAGIPLDSLYIDPRITPAAAFKVSLDAPEPYEPFPYPKLPPPRDPTGGPEGLGDALTLLANTVRDEVLAAGLEHARLRFGTNDFDGYRCLENGTACGSIDDALYMNSFSTSIPPTSSGGMFAVGIVHPDVPSRYAGAPELAYSSLTLRNEPQRMGVVGIWHTELRGTARARYPNGIPGIAPSDLDLMYVWEFARDCAGRSACTSIGDGPVEVPAGHDFNLTERAYLDHRTNTGPSAAAIVAPWSIWYGQDVRVQLLQQRVRLP